MKTAIVSITENGRKLSEKISGLMPLKRYCFHRHTDENAESFNGLQLLINNIFGRYDALIFVCACGIAVRAVSPHIVSKTRDPAVIVIDDLGKYVIPVLSGHIGGANALAGKIAKEIGAQAVITTATDIGKKFSPDSFAKANGLIISDMNAAKEIASAVLDGEKIGFITEYGYHDLPEELTAENNCRCGICVLADGSIKPFDVTLSLVPKNIVAGIGCRKNSSPEAVEDAVKSAFEANGLSYDRICAAATLDIKSGEPGLIGFCQKNKIPLITYSAEELMSLSGDFSSSEFVKKVTGTDNVCERSAVKCSGGKLLFGKTSLNGVTVAAAEKKMILDFERNLL